MRSGIESLHELPSLSETGKMLFNRATLKVYDRPTLRAIIQSIHEMDLSAHEGEDPKGDMYEYLASSRCRVLMASFARRATSSP